MVDLLYRSGAVNTTLWACCGAFLFVLVMRYRRGPSTEPAATLIQPLLSSWAFLVALAVGTGVNVGYGIYKGYVVPRDYMQDVFSAQSFIDGGSLFPPDIGRKWVAWVENHPPAYSIWPAGSSRRQQEIEGRQNAAESDWVQAHPPLMGLFFVPLVRFFGVYGTYFAITVISVSSLILSLVLIQHELRGPNALVIATSLFLLILGWDAIVAVLRSGQSGVYLSLLLILGWIGARRGHNVAAGLCIGLATCLKVYPVLTLILALVRRFRMFLAAAATILLLTGATLALCGSNLLFDYARTTRYVTETYIPYATNFSLMAAANRLGEAMQWLIGKEGSMLLAAGFEACFGIGFVLFLSGRAFLTRGREDRSLRSFDLEYALTVAAMPLLSLVSWDHYKAVLLLPLAILGQQVFHHEARKGLASVLCYLCLLAVLAIPEWTISMAAEQVAKLSPHLAKAGIMNITTIGLLVLNGWLVREIVNASSGPVVER